MTAKNSLVLSKKAYERIEAYAATAGISVERAASDAIKEWMDITGDFLIYELQRRREARAARPKLAIV
jgi:hypothetical protein